MTKARWLEFSTEASLYQIVDALNRKQFRRGEPIGVELTEVLKGSIRGRFIEEFVDNEVLLDPFGEQIFNSVRRYLIFEFLIVPLSGKRYLLRITTPPRTLKSFISMLAEVLGFGFSVSMSNVDILRLIQYLCKSSSEVKWKIKRVRISGVKLTDKSLARIEVISQADAYNELKQFVNLDGSFLERATMEINQHPYGRAIEVTSKGSISCDVDLLEKLTPQFQEFFSTMQGAA